MSNLDLKSKAGIIGKELSVDILKHIATIQICDSDNMKKIFEYLTSKGFNFKTRDITIFANDFDHVKAVVEYYEKEGRLDELKENLILVNGMKSLNIEKSNENDDALSDEVVAGEDMTYDPLKAILSTTQKVALDDDMLDRFTHLSDIARKVLFSLYDIDELSDDVVNNISKLVAAGYGDDNFVVYSSILYGKEISEEEAKLIFEKITAELDYENMSKGGR